MNIAKIAEGKLDVDALTTHTIPLDQVDTKIAAAIEEPDKMLGVVLRMGHLASSSDS